MPIMMLIRHGENDYVKKGRLAGRLQGVHLNEKGRKQAEQLAKIFSKDPVSAVYSSPLERTMETARPIADAVNKEVIPRGGLIEVDFGLWQDQKLSRLSRRKLWKQVQRSPSRMRFPQGESFMEAQLRIVNEIQALTNQHKKKDLVVCVTHSDIIKLAVAYFLGMPLDTFQRLAVSPASVTELFMTREHFQLRRLNCSLVDFQG